LAKDLAICRSPEKRQNLITGTGFLSTGLKLISVKLPEALIEGMDELVRRGLYPSRSAILRAAVRDLLKRELWGEEGKLEEE
jgi:metal-responsive CopG/Arc/MetJ family transcriptional regulator